MARRLPTNLQSATGRIDRRQALRGLAGGAGALLAGSSAAQAQSGSDWLDKLFGGPAHMRTASTAERPKADVLNDLRPNATPWRSEEMLDALDKAIARHEQIASKGGWPTIPGNRAMRPEDDDQRMPLVRQRLIASGELRGGGNQLNSFAFDGQLEEAVRRYQENNGLRVSGRIDRSTLAALNIPLQTRIAQLKLNHGRIRELMTPRPEDRYVLVNAAAYQLEAVERGEVQQRHRTIVGKPERQSPTVRANIRALNFFPFWRVPDSVATLDLIPRLRKEPEYLQNEKIRVVRGNFNGPEMDPANIDWNTATATEIKFRQDPGPQNALGLVRIDMPNSEGVYMHDTPMKTLFQQRMRAFSAGCVRVQDVTKLADWIARYEMGWEQGGRSQQVFDSGNAVDLILTRQIPVYFAYITAWAEPGDGRTQFRPDIYNRDGLGATAGRDREEGEAAPPPQTLAP